MAFHPRPAEHVRASIASISPSHLRALHCIVLFADIGQLVCPLGLNGSLLPPARHPVLAGSEYESQRALRCGGGVPRAPNSPHSPSPFHSLFLPPHLHALSPP